MCVCVGGGGGGGGKESRAGGVSGAGVSQTPFDSKFHFLNLGYHIYSEYSHPKSIPYT